MLKISMAGATQKNRFCPEARLVFFLCHSPTPHRMILRLDGLSLELPKPKNPSANDTATVQ